MSTNLIASVNHLPPEILTEIFSLSQDQSVNPLRPNLLRTIVLVCSLWRDITLNTPQLWSNLEIIMERRMREHFIKVLAIVKMYLERSQNHPLTILMTGSDRSSSLISAGLKLCAEHCHRWEDICFYIPFTTLELFLSNPETSYPRLRSFCCGDLEDENGSQRLWNPSEVEFFSNAPHLSKLDLSTSPHQVFRLKFPWSQITDFSINTRGNIARKALGYLQSMPNLVSARFVIYGGGTGSGQTAQLVTFPSLRFFSWESTNTYPSPFLDSIHAQHLAEFELVFIIENTISPLQQLVQRSGCRITNLTLPLITSPALLSILAVLPDVETLTLSGLKVTSPRFKYDPSEFQRLGPKIKRIILELYFRNEVIHEEFVSMIESRFCLPEESDIGICRLESVHVVSHGIRKGDSLSESEPIRFIRERISPQYRSLITYEGRLL